MKYPKRSQYKHAKQKKYHVSNWAEYNEGLRRRGDLTVWFDEEAIANWMADKTGKPGGQRVYSDMAIETGLVVRMVYKLAYRQTEGFLHSIASLLGLGIEIPDYSTLSRRSRLLRKKLRIPKAASNQPIHLMIDSTGLRIHVGNARKPPKQRAWRKLHIAVDRETGNIVASELTASRARDATRVPALLTQIQAPLVSVAADSAYDKEAVYEAIEAHSPGRRTRVVIPPQRNATLSQNSNTYASRLLDLMNAAKSAGRASGDFQSDRMAALKEPVTPPPGPLAPLAPPAPPAPPAAPTSGEDSGTVMLNVKDIEAHALSQGAAPSAPASAPPPSSPASLDSMDPDTRKQHEDAKRFARLLISEIKLYNEAKVQQGRQKRGIYNLLRDDIERSRQLYSERVSSDIRGATGYFDEELIRILADGDAGALGQHPN